MMKMYDQILQGLSDKSKSCTLEKLGGKVSTVDVSRRGFSNKESVTHLHDNDVLI